MSSSTLRKAARGHPAAHRRVARRGAQCRHSPTRSARSTRGAAGADPCDRQLRALRADRQAEPQIDHRPKGKIISVGADNDITTVYFERMMAANGFKKGDYDTIPAGVARRALPR